MVIKNISSTRQILGLARKLVVTLDPAGTTTVPDDAEVQAGVQKLVEKGILEVLSAPATLLPIIKRPKSVAVTVASGAGAGTVILAGVTLTLAGASATALAADLVAKINAHTTLSAAGVYAHPAVVGASSGRIVILEVADDQDINPVSDFIAAGTATGITFAVDNATVVPSAAVQNAISTATAASAALVVSTGLKEILAYQVRVVSGGKIKHVTPNVEVQGGVISFSSNGDGGAVNLASGDVVTITATGSRVA